MTQRKKLIEIALPLNAINKASAREKAIRHGHPSTLHLWWARRPLAAARAVIFAQMVDDPSGYVDELFSDAEKKRAAKQELEKRLEEHAAKQALADEDAITDPEPSLEGVIADIERDRLFSILEDLVLWENTTNETVLQRARDEIWRSWRRVCAENSKHPRAKEIFDPNKLPGFHDPFAGGGALPLEAQRLGLESFASDLNPVAVLINKAMIEIPPKFAGNPPVNPESREEENFFAREWRGAQGLAEDVRYYGQWMRDEAEKRIGYLYHKIEITAEMVKLRPDLKKYEGRKLRVIAWLWARTVKSPNPAFAQVDVPLAATFILSTKAGKEAYVEPVIEDSGYCFTVKVGTPKDVAVAKRGTRSGSSGSSFLCLMSGTPMPFEYLRSEAKAGRMSARLMAVVAEGEHGRIYLSPLSEMETIALSAKPQDAPETDLPEKALGFRVQAYGMTKWRDLFTRRQLVALTTFSDLVQEARERVQRDAINAGLLDDSRPLRDGGIDATAYAEAVEVYLGFSVSKTSNRASTLCTFMIGVQCPGDTFGRQALSMSWDFAEANIVGGPSGSFGSMVKNTVAGLLSNDTRLGAVGHSKQADACSQLLSSAKVISTDPPYYDNIPYADLSDFFYVWLRRSLRQVFPDLFATLAVPKTNELVATPYRHGSKKKAENFFLEGMTQAMHHLTDQAHPAFPVTIYYAFKQAEDDNKEGTVSTGWETFLDAVIRVGFAISGTWPMRTERYNRKRNQGANALASSIILVCRKRTADTPTTTRREFVTALKSELPVSFAYLQRGNIAPVDLAQAAIGPGMAIYTRYEKVLDAEGKPLSVREALALINQILDEALAEQEGDFDADSRWALAWFEQNGFTEGEYGVAETLSKAKNTSVSGLVEAGLLASTGGKVRLLQPEELLTNWDPTTDSRLTVWEMVHHLVRLLEASGESAAAELVSRLGAKAEAARELCYRLYTLCERKKRATEALSYNALVQSWPEIARLARRDKEAEVEQSSIFSGVES